MHNPKWMTWVPPAASGPRCPTSMWPRPSRNRASSMCPSSPWAPSTRWTPLREILEAHQGGHGHHGPQPDRRPPAHQEVRGRPPGGRHPCIKCMRCHDSTVYGHHFQCSVNPTAGLENSIAHLVQPVERVKKVAVVGGGPASMKAALVAKERGHQVTLFEAAKASWAACSTRQATSPSNIRSRIT